MNQNQANEGMIWNTTLAIYAHLVYLHIQSQGFQLGEQVYSSLFQVARESAATFVQGTLFGVQAGNQSQQILRRTG
jgi:hypothetical protein